MSQPHRHILYHRNFCFFCFRVTHAIKKLGIDVESRNIWQETEYQSELFSATGRYTVPVLRIIDEQGGSTWMPESRDIVRYLEQSLAQNNI